MAPSPERSGESTITESSDEIYDHIEEDEEEDEEDEEDEVDEEDEEDEVDEEEVDEEENDEEAAIDNSDALDAMFRHAWGAHGNYDPRGPPRRGGIAPQVSRSVLLRAFQALNSHQDGYELANALLRGPTPPATTPNAEGAKLAKTGQFGINAGRKTSNHKHADSYTWFFLNRDMGVADSMRLTRLQMQQWVPNSQAQMMIEHPSRFYCGQFSYDGNVFFSASQDGRLRFYDCSHARMWKFQKAVRMGTCHWTITDASMSRDNAWVAYSSLQPHVYMSKADPEDTSEAICLDLRRARGRTSFVNLVTYSVRFSHNGKELVAGTGGRHFEENLLCIYDIQAQQAAINILGHRGDINAVSHGDERSQEIIYTGGEDGVIKIWDRRVMAEGVPVGILLGHFGAVTHIASKGDGVYLLSNGKDHMVKLWDLRKALEPNQVYGDVGGRPIPQGQENNYPWIYSRTRRPKYRDCSVMTFTGHVVDKTLIRCGFSPPHSNDSKHVYAGSSDGKVHIWNLDATLKTIIDVNRPSYYFADRERPNSPSFDFGGIRYSSEDRASNRTVTVVRDVAWHPYDPVIATSAWNGPDGELGTISVHQWRNQSNFDRPQFTKEEKREDAIKRGEDVENMTFTDSPDKGPLLALYNAKMVKQPKPLPEPEHMKPISARKSSRIVG